MKNFFIALIIAVVLVNCLGSLVDGLVGMKIVLSNELLKPWEAMTLLSLVGVLFAAVGFVVAVSVLGTFLVVLGAGVIVLFLLGISAFWPIIIIAIALYMLKNRHVEQYTKRSDRHYYHNT